MPLVFVLIPFVVVTLLICLVKFMLIANKDTAPIPISSVNICTNIIISPRVFQKITNQKSKPNAPFRLDVKSTCLEYLCNQRMDGDCKNENTILKNLEGKL